MGNDDLFPSDFIKTLEAPTNYVGPEEVFSEYGHLRATMVLTPGDYDAPHNFAHVIYNGNLPTRKFFTS